MEERAVAVKGAGMFLPSDKKECWDLAQKFSQSSFCPSAYKNKPADVFLAMAYGAQIGLNPLLAVQNIAVINGRPSVYGDAMTAVAQGHPETKSYKDGYLDNGTAYCLIVRSKGGNEREVYREFSIEDAKTAGLWGHGNWAKYPKRMLLWRARSWAIRDTFGDVLMGLLSFDEAEDLSGDIDISAPSSSAPIQNRLKMADADPPEEKQEDKPEEPKKNTVKPEPPKKPEKSDVQRPPKEKEVKEPKEEKKPEPKKQTKKEKIQDEDPAYEPEDLGFDEFEDFDDNYFTGEIDEETR